MLQSVDDPVGFLCEASEVGLQGRFIMIAGSASARAPSDRVLAAHEYIRCLVRAILGAGGGLVVFLGVQEPIGEHGAALIFDWIVLREVVALGALSSRRVIAITSQKARSRMGPEHGSLLQSLIDSGVVAPAYIADELHTGGNISDAEVHHADAMIALGGGKGVADRAAKMFKKGGPVVPIESDVGSVSNDGSGANGLHQQALSSPERFMPWNPSILAEALPLLSVARGDVEPAAVASRTVDVVHAAFVAAARNRRVDIVLLTALPVELQAAQTILALTNLPDRKTDNGTNIWLADVPAARSGTTYRVALACLGSAGNVGAAATTAELVQTLKPAFVVMVGIAAGMRGSCHLGEVVFSERVVAYESASLVSIDGWFARLVSRFYGKRRTAQPRPDMYRLPYPIEQDVAAYVARHDTTGPRIGLALSAMKMTPPNHPDVAQVVRPRLATIASGEKLLRDPAVLTGLRSDVHGKIEIGEMEAAGIAEACRHAKVDFLIVRGISDFGDRMKNDAVHRLASASATIVSVDFIMHGLSLGPHS